MDRVSRMVLASLLLVVIFAGTVVLTNLGWMPAIYPPVVTEASTRVVIERSNVTISSIWDENYRTWTLGPFPLKKGESVTIELEVPTVPTVSIWDESVTLAITRWPVAIGEWGNVTAYTFCYAVYTSSGLNTPKACVVPETAQYEVHVNNYYRYEMKFSFKLTASPPIVPYGKAQTLMILWLLLGVGMLVGAACAFLIRPKRTPPSPLQAEAATFLNPKMPR